MEIKQESSSRELKNDKVDRERDFHVHVADREFLRDCAVAAAVKHLHEQDYTLLERTALVTFVPQYLEFGKRDLFSLTSGLEAFFKKRNGDLQKRLSNLSPEQERVFSFLIDYLCPSQNYSLAEQEERFSTQHGVLRFFKGLLWGEQNMFAFGNPIKRKSKLVSGEYTVLEEPLITLHKGPLRGIRREDTIYVFDTFNKAMFGRKVGFSKRLRGLGVWYGVLEGLEKCIRILEEETGVSAVNVKSDIDGVYLSETYDRELLRASNRNKGCVRMMLRSNDVLDALYRNAVVLKRIDRIKDPRLKELYKSVVLGSELKYVLLNGERLIAHAPTVDSLLGDGINAQREKLEEVKSRFFSEDDEPLREITKKLCKSSLEKAVEKI